MIQFTHGRTNLDFGAYLSAKWTKRKHVADLEYLESDPEAHQAFADPPMMLRTAKAGGFFRANTSFLAKVGLSEAELSAEPFLHWINPADMNAAKATIAGRQASCRIKHRTHGGEYLPLEFRVVCHEGESLVLARWVADVEMVEDPEDSNDVATVSGTLHKIARIVEDQNPGYRCSILLVADGRFVRGAGPSLPEAYNAAIDGFAIGPTVGSCGTAIYWNVPVIVEDIQADPLWAPFAELAKSAGVAACWSHPFTSTTGNVLGALALYSPVPCAPTAEQLGRLKAAAQMTGLAVERGRAEEALCVKRKRELELEQQLRQAAKLEAIGTLAGGIAHDFNNLLNTMIGFTELALYKVEKGTSFEDYLQDVYTAGQRAKDLVDQILSFARQSDQQIEPIRIDSILSEALKFIRSSIPSTIQIKKNFDSEVFIMGNATQVHQVFMNLFTNAAHAMQDDGGILAVSLKEFTASDTILKDSATLADGDFIEIKVSDTGEGISRDDLKAIFEPYFTTKPAGKGTGLGLATVYGIIESYGGTISVDSTLGKGTVFTILLPVTHQTKTNPSHEPGVLAYGSGRILVVDDEDLIVNMTREALEHLGYSVTSCNNSLEALERFRAQQNAFDLVITDMTMPHMTGDDLAMEMMKIRPEIPIILCTGYSSKVSDQSAVKIGIKALVHKPIVVAEFAETVRKVLYDSAKTCR